MPKVTVFRGTISVSVSSVPFVSWETLRHLSADIEARLEETAADIARTLSSPSVTVEAHITESSEE